ncbi:MAG: hypothetical protein JW784_00955 [Candidatus Cloacimonetes bacterium]|nr:hypothetical protein [Candidatus Cloacimonadota bacterium]
MRIVIFSLIAVIVLGCSTEGEIRVINYSEHPVYFNIQNHDYVLPGVSGNSVEGTAKTISVDTGSGFFFLGGESKSVELHLEGETALLRIMNAEGQWEYFVNTIQLVEPRQTTKVRVYPTHAGIIVVNMCETGTISEVAASKNNSNFIPVIDYDIPPGDSAWSRLQASTPEQIVVYVIRIVMDNYEVYEFYPEELFKDQQYRLPVYF